VIKGRACDCVEGECKEESETVIVWRGKCVKRRGRMKLEIEGRVTDSEIV